MTAYVTHNHFSKDLKPYGKCPACDYGILLEEKKKFMALKRKRDKLRKYFNVHSSLESEELLCNWEFNSDEEVAKAYELARLEYLCNGVL